MKDPERTAYEVSGAGRAALTGALTFSTAAALMPLGVTSITKGQVTSIDLAAVTGADSAGLALLIEWLSVAKAEGQSLHYENVPAQLQQLAKLSDVEALLAGRAEA